jgi:SynChlorMet cassette protein ScmC
VFRATVEGQDLEPYRTFQLQCLANIIATQAETRGGMLIHGALAERHGRGVVLAGPGNVGKTTAAGRLPRPWRALCDDATLVVRAPDGSYLAHPWPTWSQLISGGPADTWDVPRSVPLAGIFFLVQDRRDLAARLGTAHATCMLVENTEQVSRGALQDLGPNLRRAVRLARFSNLSALTEAIPCHLLYLGRTGAFWTTIERALGWTATAPAASNAPIRSGALQASTSP